LRMKCDCPNTWNLALPCTVQGNVKRRDIKSFGDTKTNHEQFAKSEMDQSPSEKGNHTEIGSQQLGNDSIQSYK
jgi:hypothetical protein